MPPEPAAGRGALIDDGDLVGWWDLALDGRDRSGHGHNAVPRGTVAHGASASPGIAGHVARFTGESHLEVAGRAVGRADFTLTAWINPSGATTTIGDVAAAFDPATRRGFSLGVSHSSSCGNHGNDRNLFFGLDAGLDARWTEHGRPSPSTVMVCALAVHDGDLYAGTWEAGESDVGRVYRLQDDGWVDCGALWSSNAVTRLTTHDGHLYAGVSRLRGGGSGLADSSNQVPGGRVLRYEGGSDWSDRGQLDGADSIAGLVPFDGALYAIPMYSEGVFRLTGADSWTSCGSPGRRLLALGVHDGALYGAGNDHADVVSAIAQTAAGFVVPARSSTGGGGMFRFDGGSTWSSLGLQPDTTQVYSIETYDGGMFIGTWPHGIVFRYRGGDTWERSGQLGDETEVMNLLAYNGMLYAGTLPGARVLRLDGDGRWSEVGTLDRTPDVLYRRAASMVVFRGELFSGTLPSGTVHSMRGSRRVRRPDIAGWLAACRCSSRRRGDRAPCRWIARGSAARRRDNRRPRPGCRSARPWPGAQRWLRRRARRCPSLSPQARRDRAWGARGRPTLVTAIGGMTPVHVPVWLAESFANGSIDRAVRLVWGFRNETWRVDLTDGRRLAVTRPANPVTAPAVVALTKLIQPRLRAAGIPSPTIVDPAARDATTVFATEFVEGTTGAEMLAQNGGPALIGTLLGDAWRRLRSIDPAGLALPDDWAAPHRLADLSRTRLSWAEGWLTGEERRVAASGIGALPELLAGRRPGLVHGDLVPVNMLVRDGSLAAILDFEFVRLADPLLDAAWFGQIVAFHHPGQEPGAWQAFVSAAGIDVDDPRTGDLLRTLPLVRLLEILDGDRHSEGAAHWLPILRSCIARMA